MRGESERESVVPQLLLALSGSIAAYQLAVFGQSRPCVREE